MAENNFSCIKEVIQTVHIPLPSSYVGKETKGVIEVLDGWKRQYNHQLQGILVNYKVISLKSDDSRSLVIDKPFVRYNVTAKFELFCPNIGSIVKGTINRVSHDYIGCLIHNTINATIKRLKKQPFEINQFITLDNMILFQVTCFDFYRKSIRVKGEITEECINLMKELPEYHVQSNVFESTSTYLSASEFSEDTTASDDVGKSSEKDNVHFEDDEQLSPSLLSVDYTTLKNSNSVSNFNTPNLTEGISESAALFDTPSPSQDSNSSSSESNNQSYNPSTLGEKKSKKRKLDEIVDKNELEPKKKKKHKDKKIKEKSAKKKGSTSDEKKSKKKKKSKKEELLQNNNLFANSDLLGENMTDDDLNDESSKPSATISSVEKKKNKKLKNTLEIKRKQQINADVIGNTVNNTAVTNNALVKEETSTDSGYPSPSSKTKKSKESSSSFLAKYSTDNVLQNISLNHNDSTDTSSQSSLSSKKKKHKKSKDVSNTIASENTSDHSFSLNAGDGIFRIPNTSPQKKRKKSESLTRTKERVGNYAESDETSIKEEIHSDVVHKDFKSCSPGKKNSLAFPYNNVEELMNTFSAFEPSLEDQLIHNEATSSIKEEIAETSKGKKRKRSSSDKSGQPKKKKRTEDEKSTSRKNGDKLNKKSKAKKKDKEKSKKNSKDKKKKLKDKPKSKKKSLEYKIKYKKGKKLKDVKSKRDKKSKKDKSSHRETKHVPSDVVIKSENS